MLLGFLQLLAAGGEVSLTGRNRGQEGGGREGGREEGGGGAYLARMD